MAQHCSFARPGVAEYYDAAEHSKRILWGKRQGCPLPEPHLGKTKQVFWIAACQLCYFLILGVPDWLFFADPDLYVQCLEVQRLAHVKDFEIPQLTDKGAPICNGLTSHAVGLLGLLAQPSLHYLLRLDSSCSDLSLFFPGDAVTCHTILNLDFPTFPFEPSGL